MFTGFAGPEAARVHRSILKDHAALYDRRVASRIALGETFSAADYIQLFADRAEVIAEATALLEPFDAMIYPTTSCTAPTIAEVDGASLPRSGVIMCRDARATPPNHFALGLVSLQ